MARTYKDNPKFRGHKGKRSERGENRGRRWLNEDGNRRDDSFRAPRGFDASRNGKGSSESLGY
jgi:hypothetical protein